jgi:hypothetical protein
MGLTVGNISPIPMNGMEKSHTALYPLNAWPEFAVREEIDEFRPKLGFARNKNHENRNSSSVFH